MPIWVPKAAKQSGSRRLLEISTLAQVAALGPLLQVLQAALTGRPSLSKSRSSSHTCSGGRTKLAG
jgi:hypothetical protein